MRYAIKRQRQEETQHKLILWAFGLGLGALVVAVMPDPQFQSLANTYYQLFGG